MIENKRDRKSRIACCYLTHNHPETLKEILDSSLKTYLDHSIDVCIYDDSADDMTKRLIDRYIEDGAEGLYYIDAHEARDGAEKMLMVLQGYGLPNDYEYIWPSKDRVYFRRSFLDRLCEELDKGYDVIQAADELQRWDVSRSFNREKYEDAGEFYRDYVVYLTNWEGTIRKKSTMLDGVDWELYRNKYGLDSGDPFFHPMSVIVRLIDMQSFNAGIVRFEKDERIISGSTESAWKNQMFSIWIDKWVRSNYALPSSMDQYKYDAIRSQTGLPELFGSAEAMMDFASKDLFNEQIFEKYRSLWSFVTDMPIEWLEMIAERRDDEVKALIIDAFEEALSTCDYLKALRLISTNMWFDRVYDEETYNILCICFYIYKKNMIEKQHSYIFDGADSVASIIERYKELKPADSTVILNGNIQHM